MGSLPTRAKADELFERLQEAGLPAIPGAFSVVPTHQAIPRAVIESIERFVRVFDAVTTRSQWRRTVAADAVPIARETHAETCFFSAWDMHLPPGAPEAWKLIEFNDNGSGFMFASRINRLYYETAGLAEAADLEPPASVDELDGRIADSVENEAREFFGRVPAGLFLILDDASSLSRGRFRREHDLLAGVLRARGLRCAIGTPAELSGDEAALRYAGQTVCFVVNRSTDFFWEADAFAPLRAAWRAGNVYAVPNPSTYATRSDKQLLALLSNPHRDEELGIEGAERAVLDAHVPETLLLSPENLRELAERKDELVFKPAHGFAGRGVLAGDQVGEKRLRRMLRAGHRYVAQRRVPKTSLSGPDADGTQLWTDLRIWAYRGRRFLLSGRASTDASRLALSAPGGWLPTYCRR
jgi:hypothetical protein